MNNTEDEVLKELHLSLVQNQDQLESLKGQLTDMQNDLAELREMAMAAFPKEYLRLKAEKIMRRKETTEE